jgi:hypothetical protein
MQHFWFQTTHPTNANASKSDHRKSHGTLGDHVTMIRSCNYLPSKEKLQRLLRMLPCTIVAFGVRNIRTDDATAKPNHHKLIRTNRRQRSHAEEALMPCGRLYSRIICEVAPTNCPACHQKNNRISTPTRPPRPRTATKRVGDMSG